MDFNADIFTKKIFEPNLINFDDLALQLFSHQFQYNEILQKYTSELGAKEALNSLDEITFLPVEFFKSHEIKTNNFIPETIFTSSGTTGMIVSKHFVKEISTYQLSYQHAFQLFYGDVKEYCVLALLPSYLERDGSSLVVMVDGLIKQSNHPLSGFYLTDFEKLFDTLIRLKSQKQKTILIGVTFALLDFAEQFSLQFDELIVMETGGMKGRRNEMIREEVHQVLKTSFSLSTIHSEYGMTELLSQAYSKGDGKFICPPWMKIVITDANDPMQILPIGKTGIINVIDLANSHSCAFIKTADVGKLNDDGTFEVMGRIDNSDVRGCSLLYL
jgi:phenylacetate-coenzyme A ligase PaaK-like adenylate-forming protein